MTTTTNTTTDKTTNMTITQEQLDAFRAALENEENPRPHWTSMAAMRDISPNGWAASR